MAKRHLLERRIRLVGLFLEGWREFYALISEAQDSTNTQVSSDKEEQFLRVRSQLLQEHNTIMEELGMSMEMRRCAHQALYNASSLQALRKMDGSNVQKIENWWNEVFTRFETILGELKQKKSELASRGPFSLIWRKVSRISLYAAATSLAAYLASFTPS